MPRWMWFLPVSCMTLAAGYFGLKQGQSLIDISETKVINAVARNYVQTTGGSATDCYAYPVNDGPEWLVVSCGSNWHIGVDQFGRTLWTNTQTIPDA